MIKKIVYIGNIVHGDWGQSVRTNWNLCSNFSSQNIKARIFELYDLFEPFEIDEMRRWCEENFKEEHSIILVPGIQSRTSITFKNVADAAAFKLRWL